MDLHRDSIQITIVCKDGKMESNSRMPNTFKDIDDFFSEIPQNAGIVMEYSSASEAIFLHLRDTGYDPVPSNPYETRAIAHSRIKTDKIDAKVLAELLPGDYISTGHMPSRDMLEMRHLVRRGRYWASQREP